MPDAHERPPIDAEEVDLSVQIGPVRFPNPIFTASGTWGYGLDYLDLVDPALLGGVVTKTITVEPRLGNPQPRVRELPTGLLNSIGLENVGLSSFLEEKLPPLREAKVRVIVSLAGRDEAEFASMARELSRHEGWHGIELNLSCPNVSEGGLDFGIDPAAIRRITELTRAELPSDKCLWAKLTPNDAPIEVLARAASAGGAHAVTCINTVVGCMVDLASHAPVFARGVAGYSGPGIKPIALAKVWQVAKSQDLPVIAVGGIGKIEDILEFFVVGASAVQLGTSLFPRPDLAHTLLLELAAALAARGLKSPAELRSELLN